jgi:hypothetical protein
MLTPCGVCQGALSSDDTGHLVRCSGICNRSFHIKCVSISIKVCQYLNFVAGLNWKCESCNNSCFSIDHEGLLKFLDTKYNEILGNLKDVFGGLRDDFSKFAKATLSKPSDTDTTSKDVASYSAVVKNKTDPAIIIKSKDSRIKIVGLTQNYSDEDYASLVEYVVKMNGSVFNLDSYCRVIRVFPTKKKPDVFQAIMEIDRLAYETVMKRGGLVVGYDHCVVYDALEVSRYFNCNDFNYSSRSCCNVRSCPRCSLDHDVKSCKSETLKCINCVRLNKSKNLNLDVAHAAWDTGCPAYRTSIDKLKEDILAAHNWNCYYSNLNSLLAKFDELLTSVLSGSPHLLLRRTRSLVSITTTLLSTYRATPSIVEIESVPGVEVFAFTLWTRFSISLRSIYCRALVTVPREYFC